MCLTFLSATAEETTRVFGDPSPSETGLRQTSSPSAGFPPYSLAVRAPSARCARTAAALGLEATPEPALRDFDYGQWYGRAVADVAASDPHGYSAWFTDPDSAPHGGESVRQLCLRTAHWLSHVPPDADRALAIVESSVIRAALVHALSAPVRAFWHLDVPWPSTISLIFRDGSWNVRFGYGIPRPVRRAAHDVWGRPGSGQCDTGTAGWVHTGATPPTDRSLDRSKGPRKGCRAVSPYPGHGPPGGSGQDVRRVLDCTVADLLQADPRTRGRGDAEGGGHHCFH
ncbi:histidine phosphatase family protein [Streptomyces sp. NPDC005202]|uniref:histidine phosphatase family protein n=1 Tax=Streptomyces sp. NPDC005202 TaxID=3157021 RepID=UPI0033B71CFC